MTWSNKYKKSINCNNPKGFSQRAHCQARKLRQVGKKTESKPVNEARIDKHEVSGKVVIDGHVFSDAGKSGRSTYGRYSVKDPNYVKDPKEVGMHRNYRKPSSLNFSTLADAKKWVKTQPKKSAEEIDRIHKKHAEFEKYMNESTKMTSLEKFRQAATERQKKHDEMEKQMKARHAAGKEDLKGAIDRLEKAVKKEDVSMVGGSPANVAGSGAVAGLGVGPQGEPGVKLRNKKKVVPFAIFSRKPTLKK